MEKKSNASASAMDSENKSYNCGRSNNSRDDENRCDGVPIHSQVIKIKKEFEKIKHPSLTQTPEMRRVRHEITGGRKRSKSPLGLAERPISIGNS